MWKLLVCVVHLALFTPPSQARNSVQKWGRVISAEYCDYETFEAACNNDERIIISTALYGHMAQGKCIKLDTPYFGCQTSVQQILDEKCSGRQRCSLPVDAEILRKTEPCTPGITVYLEATYICAKVVGENRLCNGITATTTTAYISSAQSKLKRCTQSTGVFDQEFTINAQPGQHLLLKLIDLSKFGRESTVSFHNEELGYILDTKSEKVFPIQQSGSTERQVALTEGSTASVVLSSNPPFNFMISFKAVGCADLTLPQDVWIKRDGDTATVGCHESRQTWQLRCINAHWSGVIGNCTIAAAVVAPVAASQEADNLPLPRDIIFAIIGSATFFIAVVVITAGYVCLKWPKNRQRNKSSGTDQQFGTIKLTQADMDTMKSSFRNERDSVALSQGDYQPIWDNPLPRLPNNDMSGTAVRAKRNNEDTYNMSLSSNSTDYERKKYYVLDKDYMNVTMST